MSAGHGAPPERMAFASAAARLAGVMGALAGWSPDAFWTATPTEAAGVLAVLVGQGDGAGGTGREPMGDAAMIATLLKGMPDG